MMGKIRSVSKVAGFVLEHGSHPFQAQAGIDVLVLERGVAAVRFFVVLGEHQVPQFQEPSAVAAGPAVRAAAAPFFAQVDVDFGIRAAGTAAGDFPPVVFQFHDPFRRNPAHIMPQVIGFLVLGVYGNPQFVRRQFQHLGEEFPGPGDHFLLEVVPEGEVPQHFEIGMVPGRASHVFNVPGTDTFLAGGDPGRRGFHLAGKVRLKRSHACADQKKRRVIVGNQGSTGQYQVSPFLKEIKILLSNLVAT